MDDEDARCVGRGARKDLLHPLGFRARKVTLHRHVIRVPGQRAQGHTVTAQGSHDHGAGNFEDRGELGEVLKVLAVLDAPAS